MNEMVNGLIPQGPVPVGSWMETSHTPAFTQSSQKRKPSGCHSGFLNWPIIIHPFSYPFLLNTYFIWQITEVHAYMNKIRLLWSLKIYCTIESSGYNQDGRTKHTHVNQSMLCFLFNVVLSNPWAKMCPQHTQSWVSALDPAEGQAKLYETSPLPVWGLMCVCTRVWVVMKHPGGKRDSLGLVCWNPQAF
jgi:hypothetical protein